MSASSPLKDNPKGFKCSCCQTPMPKRMSMSGGPAAMTKGMLIVCSACSRVNVLGESDLHPLTRDEFLALDKFTQQTLLKVAKGIKQLVDSGGSWNPHMNQ